ncbi:flagellar assembly peptidoglycan hydrolase FlgJ [Candidimonas sp. SYP-B2681]|uniref:flagellar assembly peptidoglycan hydrolase FlgJ n=1 Tax=Candidimonas sp. SYP-B2681 TaxID=2497686 RepID=UPI000F87AF81|nr:flagellar assembly peptidoglycan hydrolase FlgJ [Candidimonas sp. SYP-B2681]RTZ47548.1 flagellar assembly peptidoglycan hydrolase FlgJ [Candidimonas sp. SYP-B2681]
MSLVQFTPLPSEPTVSTLDFNGLNGLKRGVRDGAAAPLDKQKQVAQQFEALFIQQMMKQARQVSTTPTLFDSQQTKLAQSMSDEQMALQLANPGIGLAQALLAQIQGGNGGAVSLPGSTSGVPELAASRLPALRSRVGEGRRNDAGSISDLIDMLAKNPLSEKIYSAIKGAPQHIQNFVSKMSDAAKLAGNQSGVPAKLILSQAALESGWGRREIMREDGTTTHNLFGIKASPNWKGKVVNIMTTEYEDGVARKVKQPFRAYDSYAESFADYARLIGTNKRYSDVVGAASAEVAARKIQAAGYATDPAYAEKLISIMSYFDTGAKR